MHGGKLIFRLESCLPFSIISKQSPVQLKLCSKVLHTMSLVPMAIQGYGASIDEEISRQLGVIWNIRDLFLQACQSEQQVGIGRALEPFDVQHWKEERHDDAALRQAQPSQDMILFNLDSAFEHECQPVLMTQAGVTEAFVQSYRRGGHGNFI